MEIFPYSSSFLELVVNYVCIAMASVQFFWTIFFHARISFHKERPVKAPFPPVSVIIIARNEEDNLSEFLPYIFEQNYNKYEVIVVNNQSVDNTHLVLKAFQAKYHQLHVINLEKNAHLSYGKKLSLTLAIKGAKYEHVLVTEPHCKPASKRWITDMAGRFNAKKKIVFGYANYEKAPGLLNRIIRIDNFFSSLQDLSFSKAHFPYRGTHQNIAYTKTLFLKNDGFKDQYSFVGGEDDIFIQKIVKRKNHTLSLSPLSFTLMETEKNWNTWLKRKSKTQGIRIKYSVFKKALLGIYPLSLLLLFISFVTLLSNNWECVMTLSFFLITLLLKWLILGKSLAKLGQHSLTWGILGWELLYSIFNPILYYSANTTKYRNGNRR